MTDSHKADLNNAAVQDYMQEVQQFIDTIENTNIKIVFDPNSEAEINACITNMEQTIDAKAANFSKNKTVTEKSIEIKTYFKKQILATAEQMKAATNNH